MLLREVALVSLGPDAYCISLNGDRPVSLLVVVGLTVIKALDLVIFYPISTFRLLRFFAKFRLLLLKTSKDSLNLLYKALAEHLRIFNQVKAHCGGFAPKNKCIIVLTQL